MTTTSGAAPLLRARGLVKRFGRLAAVGGVDLELRPGEIVGLIGPNGSGKTTVLNLLSGLLPATGGSIEFRGHAIQGAKPYQRARLGLARTFQVVRPLPGLSVVENVLAAAAFGRADRRLAYAEAYAEALRVLETVGLTERVGAPTSSLPIQDLKRLELARALATGPVLLLLDEVLAGLDAEDGTRLLRLLEGQRAAGLTILMVEHRIDMLFSIIDRVVVLDQGQVIAEGTPAEAAVHPEVIRAYLGHRYAMRLARRQEGAGA